MALAPSSLPSLATAAQTAMEPPIVKREASKKEAEVLRRNIELFVDGVMLEDKYKLVDLLNESFTMEMLDLLFKRMTAKLRMMLFSREKTNELIGIALNAALPRHTRALATSFIVVGSAASCVVSCPPDNHKCLDFWHAIFGALQKEAAQDAAAQEAMSGGVGEPADDHVQQQQTDQELAVQELVELIQIEVKDIEHHGAKSLQRSAVEQAEAEAVAANSAGNDEEEEHEHDRHSRHEEEEEDHEETIEQEQPRTPTSARSSAAEDEASPSSSDPSPSPSPPPKSTGEAKTDDTKMPLLSMGLFSDDSANFSSQILRYFAIRGQKGACILHFLSQHPRYVDLLLANIGHDDTRILLLHLIYADHTDMAIEALFKTQLMDKMIDVLVCFGPPRNAFERDRVENTFLLLREIIHAPYLTARGVAISAKTIPLDKITGQDEYVSICGASREMANSSLRKYTSRKVRHVIHLFMEQNQFKIEQLFVQMIKELTFWSCPIVEATRQRRASITQQENLEALSLVGAGHPRPVCTAMLTHLFELTETVDFSEEHSKKAGPHAAASATSVGIDCLNFMCSTHLVQNGNLLVKKKMRNEIQQCQVSVNCMMGVRITSLRLEDEQQEHGHGHDHHPSQPSKSSNTNTTSKATAKTKPQAQSTKPPTSAMSTALDAGFVHNKGNQTQIPLDEIDSVEPSDWHTHGFVITVKRKTLMAQEMGYMSEIVSKTQEFFAASSKEEQEKWLHVLRQVISGDLAALEIFCSDDWRSNVREYRKLRECLITSMEHKGHEIMVFLKQVVVQHTRKASGFHLWTIVKFLNAVLSNESKRLDQMFVSAQLLDVLIACYSKFPMWSLLLGEITKMVVFCVGDFKNKRSRRCPIIGKLLLSDGPLLPLLSKVFIGTEGGQKSDFYGTDTLSNLKLLMESLKLCYSDPKSRSQERIQAVLQEDPNWQLLIQEMDNECAKNPSKRITSVPVAAATSSSHTASSLLSLATGSTPTTPVAVAPPLPSQPAFQEDIINQITRPCYFSVHGFGSSFILGDGCAYGYMFKERQGGTKWQKVLLVYEYVSYKLWYFYPSEVDDAPSHHIQWKWIIPVAVRARYTHGHDESHSSVGHHGLFVTSYDHHDTSGSFLPHTHSSSFSSSSSSTNGNGSNTRELHFSVTKLEDRDQWKQVLSDAAKTVQQLAKDYTAMQTKNKKPDKKLVTHCQDATCKTPFKLFKRPHSCKRCGKWFCGKCSHQRLSIPEVGLMQPVRHCRSCFEEAGGLEAAVEPTKLFHQHERDSASSVTSTNGRASHGNGSSGNGTRSGSGSGSDVSHGSSAASFTSNVELYELAHGMVSPRSMLQIRRRMNRQDSIDSPTSSGFKVDEMDGQTHFFGDDYHDDDGGEDVLSPYGSPGFVGSPRPNTMKSPTPFLLGDEEDLRG